MGAGVEEHRRMIPRLHFLSFFLFFSFFFEVEIGSRTPIPIVRQDRSTVAQLARTTMDELSVSSCV